MGRVLIRKGFIKEGSELFITNLRIITRFMTISEFIMWSFVLTYKDEPIDYPLSLYYVVFLWELKRVVFNTFFPLDSHTTQWKRKGVYVERTKVEFFKR